MSEAFPGIELIGGTAIGGFTEDSGYVKDGYFLCLLVSDTTTFISGCIKNLSSLLQTGTFTQTFRNYLEENYLYKNPAACLLYSAYHNVDGDKLVNTVQEILPDKCLTFGGIATDYWSAQDLANFSKKTPPAEKTLQFHAKDGVINVEDDTLVFLLLEGNFTVKYEVCYGWSDIGILYSSRGDGTFLTEIDGQNPRTFLRQLQHPLASDKYDNMEYSLWIHVPGKDPYIRDIFFDKATGRYHTQGSSLPSQFKVSFSFPNKETVLKEFQNCLGNLSGQHDLVIASTCCTHQVVLEKEICQEYSEMVKMFQQTPLLCNYVFGEIGPSITDRKSMLHSCSSILVCLQDENSSNEAQDESLNTFLDKIISEQSQEIKSLKKQLRFFEGSKQSKMTQFAEDCLGMLLCSSHRSLSNHAEHLSKCFKEYYQNSGKEPPYPISRNRIIEHLMALKKRARKFFRSSSE